MLRDKSRASHKRPNEYSEEIKTKIRELRQAGVEREKRYLGPRLLAHRLRTRYGIEVSPSGIGKFLHKEKLIPEHNIKKEAQERKDKVL